MKGKTMATKEIQTAEISLENPKDFANELWSKIVDERLFSYQKNDICDYLLYLFNAHSKDKFLDTNSNEQNERLLKMNASKIKASKKNIAIKFMDNDEYNDIFKRFLEMINNGEIILREGKEHKIKFTLEDKAMQDVLNAKLKANKRETLEPTNFGSENVEISIKSFIAMLESAVKDFNKPQAELEKAIHKCKGIDRNLTLGKIFDAVANAPQDYGVSFLRELVSNAYGIFVKK